MEVKILESDYSYELARDINREIELLQRKHRIIDIKYSHAVKPNFKHEYTAMIIYEA